MPSCTEGRDAFKATSSARNEKITAAESNRDLGPGSWLDKTWDGELKGRGCPDPGPEWPGRCCRVCSILKVLLKKKRKEKKRRFWRQKPRAETMRLTHVSFQRFLRNVATTKKIIYPSFSVRRYGNSNQHAKKKKQRKKKGGRG